MAVDRAEVTRIRTDGANGGGWRLKVGRVEKLLIRALAVAADGMGLPCCCAALPERTPNGSSNFKWCFGAVNAPSAEGRLPGSQGASIASIAWGLGGGGVGSAGRSRAAAGEAWAAWEGGPDPDHRESGESQWTLFPACFCLVPDFGPEELLRSPSTPC